MIQFSIALIFLFLAEIIGVWFLNNKLNIAPNLIDAANWIFQFTILTTIITVIQVPFTAMVLSYEKMGVYSVIEIISVIIKLASALLIKKADTNQLVLYGALILLSHLVIFITYDPLVELKS